MKQRAFPSMLLSALSFVFIMMFLPIATAEPVSMVEVLPKQVKWEFWQTYDGYNYTRWSDGSGSISDYFYDQSDVVIPDALEGYPIKRIENRAFSGRTELIIVSVPNTVVSIGEQAFSDCPMLTNVTIPPSVTSIADNAFENSSRVTLLVAANSYAHQFALEHQMGWRIDDSLSQKGKETSQEERLMAYSAPPYAYRLLEDNTAEIVDFDGNDSIITIPASFHGHPVSSIGDYAFMEVNGLEEVTIPKGVKQIGKYAFNNSRSLRSVEFPDGLLTIGEKSFVSTGLTEITVPGSVQSIEDSAFSSCNELKNVVLNEGLIHIGETAFAFCDNLTKINLPQSVTSVKHNILIFSNQVKLTVIADSYGQAYAEEYELDYVIKGKEHMTAAEEEETRIIPKQPTQEALSMSEALALKPQEPSLVPIGQHHKIGVIEPNPMNDSSYGGGGNNFNILIRTDNAAEIVWYHEGKEKQVHIPHMSRGYLIRYIGKESFKERKKITQVALPDSIISIGADAFRGCESLAYVIVPPSVEFIDSTAFLGCDSLTLIVASDSYAQQYAQSHGIRFETEIFPASAFVYQKEQLYLFEEFGYRLLDSNTVEIASYTGYEPYVTVPASINGATVSSIGGYAFAGSDTLQTVSLPDTITSIGTGAFRDCEFLNHVKLPDGLKILSPQAFRYCMNLEEVNLPDTVIRIGEEALRGTGIRDFRVPKGVLVIEFATFADCSKLRNIMLPEGLLSIEGGSFESCYALSSLTIPASVSNIGSSIFFFMEKPPLVAVIAGSYAEQYYKENDLPYISMEAKQGVHIAAADAWGNDKPIPGTKQITDDYTTQQWTDGGLEIIHSSYVMDLSIPAAIDGHSMKRISANAFSYGNEELWRVTIPSSVSFIGKSAFSSAGIHTISIPEGVQTIENFTFLNCKRLYEVGLPATLTRINPGAFLGCTTLLSISLPEGLTSIGAQAFGSCKSLHTLTIPESVTDIDADAFIDCPELILLVYQGSYAEQYVNEHHIRHDLIRI